MRYRTLTGRMLSALVLPGLFLVSCSRSTSRAPAEDSEEFASSIVPVGVEPAQVGTLRAAIHASGSVVPSDGAEFLVLAPEPARIIEVTRNQGDPVNAGDLLVRFELPTAAQEVARQQSEVARTQAQFENVRVNRQRIADFVERGLVARNDLNQAERELTDAQTAVATATAALKRAQDTVARASVRAPFSGIVVNRLHNPGDLAQPSSTDPVLRVIDPNRLEVQVNIPGADASRVLPGASARVAGFVDGQPVALSVVGRPGGTPDADGRLKVRLTFAAPTTLMVDSPVEVDIDGEERPRVVFVAPTSLVSSPPNAALFVAVNDVAQRRAVKTGVTTELGVEIIEGLEAGELVITRGQATVKDGDKISAAVTK